MARGKLLRSTKGSGIRMDTVLPAPLNTKAMDNVIRDDLRKMGRGIKKDLAKTTATWDTPVNFQMRTKNKKGILEMEVRPKPGTKGEEIFNYVDRGTKPHTIEPKKPGGVLSFMWGGPGSYKAKTKPRVIGSTSGGATGAMVAFTKVKHPGTRARKFSDSIARRWAQLSRKFLPKTMSVVVKVSGHSMRRKYGKRT